MRKGVEEFLTVSLLLAILLVQCQANYNLQSIEDELSALDNSAMYNEMAKGFAEMTKSLEEMTETLREWRLKSID